MNETVGFRGGSEGEIEKMLYGEYYLDEKNQKQFRWKECR